MDALLAFLLPCCEAELLRAGSVRSIRFITEARQVPLLNQSLWQYLCLAHVGLSSADLQCERFRLEPAGWNVRGKCAVYSLVPLRLRSSSEAQHRRLIRVLLQALLSGCMLTQGSKALLKTLP